MMNRLLGALAFAATVGCAGTAYEQHEGQVDLVDAVVEAEMRLSEGARIGTLRLAEIAGDSVRISGSLVGLPPGQHGIHVHQVGRCDPPAFESAGAHFNPDSQEHGLLNPKGPHAGDAPNITVDARFRATVNLLLSHVTLKQGPRSILDANGAAVIVHAAPDDQQTDPSGNSGARIACGVIRKGS